MGVESRRLNGRATSQARPVTLERGHPAGRNGQGAARQTERDARSKSVNSDSQPLAQSKEKDMNIIKGNEHTEEHEQPIQSCPLCGQLSAFGLPHKECMDYEQYLADQQEAHHE